MVRTALKWLLLAALVGAVFLSAKYLDGNPFYEAPETEPTERAHSWQDYAQTEPTGVQEQPTETTAPPEPAETEPAETEPAERSFLLSFVGDCTLGANPTNYYAGFGFIKTVGEDYGYPFRNVIDWFENDECSFINLEGPLTDEGFPVQKEHTFKGPTAYRQILTDNSIDAVTIANNHARDYGATGYESTIGILQQADIPYVERDNSCIFTTENGLKIGMYGAVYYHMDMQAITDGISALAEQDCDLVIFAPHWGFEGSYRPTEEQIELAHAAIDAGADIVWGSHPHVLQPIEEYNGGIIFYSLGNFSFGGNGYPEDFDTALLQQEVIRGSDGTVRLGELIIIPASISSTEKRNNYQPTPYPQDSEGYERVMHKLGGTWEEAHLIR